MTRKPTNDGSQQRQSRVAHDGGQPARPAATGATATFQECRVPAEETLSQAAIGTSDSLTDAAQTPDDN